MKTFDLAIVGAGIIGLSAAFDLAESGLQVIVLDRQEPGRESSWAAAGMLAPGPESRDSTTLVPLAKESLALYPQFVAAVEEDSGKSTAFAREGTLEVFHGPSAELARDQFIAEHRRHGLTAEPIPVQTARKMEPSLNASPAVAWLPNEATVDPRLLVDALASAVENRGVQIRANCSVTSLLGDDICCRGVVAGGEEIVATHTLITAGSFCGKISPAIARHAPTHPVRGQMIALRHASVRLTRVLRSDEGYLVPRADGRIIAGTTLENAGFTKTVTPEGLQKIFGAALELVPDLANAEILETWSGLRPGTPDDLPILGPTATQGLIVATGHYRNGILLAPITAKLVREWITEGRTSMEIGAFSPLRFQASGSHAAAAVLKLQSRS